MADAKIVYVVIKQVDAGQVVLVASTLAKASTFIDNNPYSGFTIVERVIDVPQT